MSTVPRAFPLTLALVASFLAPPGADAQSYNVRHYTNADGLPQSQILALHQSSEGYVWIATYGGVGRYDGSTIRTFTTAHGLSSNLVQAIAEDSAGHLFLGTLGGGLCILGGTSIRCLAETDGFPARDVIDLAIHPDGAVWAATGQGLVRLHRGEVTVLTTADGLPSDSVLSLTIDPADGRMWIGTAGGAAILEDDSIHQVPDPLLAGLAIHTVTPVFGGILVGTEAGLVLVSPEGSSRVEPSILPADATVHDAAGDGAGGVWIGTSVGLLHFDGNGFLLLTAEDGLPANDILRVMVDREGNVWTGTDVGLGKLVLGPFMAYSTREGLPHRFARAIGEDQEGRVWVGTRHGAARWSPGEERFEVIVPGDALPDGRVYALARAPEGGMLVGTRDGLVHWEGGAFRRLGIDAGLPNSYVLSLLPEERGGVWIGTQRGIARWRDGVIEGFPPDHPLAALFAVSLELDRDERLWIGLAAGGVRIWDGDAIEVLDASRGLTDQVIWSLARDSQGRMWIGSNGAGAFRIDGTGVTRFTTADGLANDFIWQILVDSRDDVWLYSNQGLNRYRPDRIDHFVRADGLLELEGTASAAIEDSEGRLWFGSGAGVISYDPSAEHLNLVPPPVRIEEINLAGQSLDLEGALRFPSGLLQLRFSALTFRDERAVRFRYRLRRGDREIGAWSPFLADRSVSFANLPPGRFTVEVEAVSGAGVVSEEPATLEFTVTPAFWQSWWSRGFLLLLLLALSAGIVWIRARRAREEKGRLERLVAERTVELESVNQSLRAQMMERERFESALRESEARFREIVENTQSVFYTHTPDHRITYISPRVRELLGTEPEEALDRWIEFATDHPLNEKGIEITARAIETGEPQPPYELELRHADGHPVRVRVVESPVLQEGVTVHMVGSLTDVTETLRAEDERRRLEKQLREAQKMEAIGRLAAGIAHDFNNLLTSIMGNTSLVKLELGTGHPLEAELAEVEFASERAAQLVGQLLAFGRKQMVQPVPKRLNESVPVIMAMLSRVIGTNIDVVLELGPEDPWITIDGSQMDQILLNLSVNARDAMPHGGTLTVATSAVMLDHLPPEPEGEELSPGRYAVIRVSDTGIGMSAEVARRIFEPFFTTKGLGDGSGLGMATVYGIVKQNRGHIEVETTPGSGATFTIHFPETASPE